MVMAVAALGLSHESAMAQGLSTALKSGSVDYKSINVQNIPESQIKEMATKIQAAGFDLESALEQAKNKGANTQQISILRRRLTPYFKTQSKTTQSANQKDVSELGSPSKPISVRAVVEEEPVKADTTLFGYSIFNKSGLTFTPETSMAVGENYVIGVGDEIAVDIYGATEQTYELTVASDGTVVVPMVGPIKVGGQTVEEARRNVVTKLKRIHADLNGQSKASLRVTSPNPVTISVMGEAHMPGTFTVPASASLFNVLYLSGGPNVNGSFRDIQLIRGGKIIAHLDIYDFLLNGKNDVNPSLVEGDIVMIPTYAKRVTIEGAFKRNGIFEAKEGETVADLIRYAGGFTPDAKSDHVGVYRIGKYTTEYKDVTDIENEMIVSGDKITCGRKKTERIDNAVTIEGAVFAPGVFEYQEGMTLKSLIEKAGGLTENAFLTRGVISRYKDDFTLEALNFNVLDAANGTADMPLRSNDIVTIASIDDMRERPVVTINGRVAVPGTYEYHENLTLGDLIVLAGGLQEYASLSNVEIIRRLSSDDMEKQTRLSGSVETVTITRDLNMSGGNDFKLEPFDVVSVRQYAAATIGGSVTVSGAVVSAGSFGLTSNAMPVSEIIARCGGLTESADIDAIRVFRKYDISDTEREIRKRMCVVNGDTATYSLLEKNELYEYVNCNIRKALEEPGCEYDILMRDGDRIEVPIKAQTVRVSGTVQNPSNVIWRKRLRADDYVDAVGGFASRAAKKKTYVVHANGEADRVHHFLFIRIYPKVTPGAEVIVPKKPESTMTVPTIISMTSSVISMVAVVFAMTK